LPASFDAPFFKEFTLRCSGDAAAVLAEVNKSGFHGGIALGQFHASWSDLILVAVTEKRSKAEIDGLVAAYRRALAG
jgi:glycine dehydrogenase subunit 1